MLGSPSYVEPIIMYMHLASLFCIYNLLHLSSLNFICHFVVCSFNFKWCFSISGFYHPELFDVIHKRGHFSFHSPPSKYFLNMWKNIGSSTGTWRTPLLTPFHIAKSKAARYISHVQTHPIDLAQETWLFNSKFATVVFNQISPGGRSNRHMSLCSYDGVTWHLPVQTVCLDTPLFWRMLVWGLRLN